jgi:hypothetical protein
MLKGDCERLDPRIRRTRQLLHDALRRLLEEKEFDKVTIQDITKAATLNRATFYAHYPDKFALLGELIRRRAPHFAGNHCRNDKLGDLWCRETVAQHARPRSRGAVCGRRRRACATNYGGWTAARSQSLIPTPGQKMHRSRGSWDGMW